MTAKEELSLMKVDPRALFNHYMQMLADGVALDESQLPKFEYLKKLFITED
jgi:hypothetical protein